MDKLVRCDAVSIDVSAIETVRVADCPAGTIAFENRVTAAHCDIVKEELRFA
jgi:hypothetical protein